MNKKIISALIAVLIIAGAAGAAVVLYSPTPTEGEQVTVMIPYVPNPCYIPHYVGVEKGFYAEEGLNVIIQYTPKGSADAIAQLIGGNAQFIQAGGDSIILARSNNIPVLAAYQVGHENLFGAAVKSETNITRPKDFEGKTIGIIGPGIPPEIAIKAMIKKDGGDYNTVNFVPVGASIIPILMQDKADAIGVYMVQVVLLENMPADVRVFYGKDYGANFVTLCIATTEEIANSKPELVKKFLLATDKAYRYSIEHPEEATDIFVKYNPESDKTLSLEIWKRYVDEDIAADKYPLGEINETQWTLTRDILYDVGVIQKKIDVSTAYSKDFVPA